MGYQANGRGGRGNGLDLFGSADESGGELLDVEQSTLRISSLPNMVTKQARAIMDYEPLNANELAVRQNEVCTADFLDSRVFAFLFKNE